MGAACAFPTFVGGFCEPGYILASRFDYVFSGLSELGGVDISTLDYRYGAALLGEPTEDLATSSYAGTLELYVPVGVRGTFTIGFFGGNGESALLAATNAFIDPLALTPARITVLDACLLNSDCDDEDLCTTDICGCDDPPCKAGGTCSNEKNFNEQTSCCNPSTGAVCPKPTGLPADFNNSGTADLYDIALFQACFGRVPLAGACESVDMDCDCDAELDDWEAIAPSLTGPNGP